MYPSRTICGETFVSLLHHHARRDAQALWLSIVFLLGRNFCGAVQNVRNQGIILSREPIARVFGQTFLHSQELILSAIFGGLRFSILWTILLTRDVSDVDSCHERDRWTAFCLLAASIFQISTPICSESGTGTAPDSATYSVTAWCFSCFQRLRKALAVKPTSHLL
jgi:hypothetical protein